MIRLVQTLSVSLAVLSLGFMVVAHVRSAVGTRDRRMANGGLLSTVGILTANLLWLDVAPALRATASIAGAAMVIAGTIWSLRAAKQPL
jgi:hypothetical protein